ncbi:hypothetical protein GH714_017973 [Hevea brasiliensis]|uniref:Macro domain-containing protein n=1 Tax=Hevea brasiliensis TaxID=3981 RepID=A0A6A6M2A4_HEVBR|nr:hypothetical protein GH714_017973 [Hevea brasiliensis]
MDFLTEKSGEEETKPIVVILVGAPGSGKSTFCEHVMCSSSRPWVRICQDTINNGKAGTKPQCLKAAASALKEGKSVFIDRCNLDREQRVEFVKLGGSQIDVHAVVLDLPAQLCISRSVKRTGHEGNLQGGKAAAVVNRMLQKKELPKLSEGLSRIMFCQSESDVQAAINTYCALGPLDTLPNGSFGQKNPDAKVQLGIMKFLKKVDVPSNAGSSSGSVQDSAFPQVSKERNNSCKGPDNLSSLSAACKEVKESEDLPKHSIGCDVTPDSIPTLAFPSISTADFQFNSEKASDIMVEKVEEFVKKLGNARLVLVDLSHGSKILSLVRVKAAQRNIDSKKFFTFVGDITQLYSQGGLRCNVIANAANWRLKPGGGGVNAAIFSAAGPALEVATKERAASLLPGHAVVVPLPSNSPLYIREGTKRDGNSVSERSKKCKGSHYEIGTDGTGSGSTQGKISNDNSKIDGSTSKSWASWAQALCHIAMHPEKHKNVLLEISDDVAVLNDLYPKAQKHLLILARCEGLDCLADVQQEHLQLLTTMHDVGLRWAEKFLHEDSSMIFALDITQYAMLTLSCLPISFISFSISTFEQLMSLINSGAIPSARLGIGVGSYFLSLEMALFVLRSRTHKWLKNGTPNFKSCG